MTDGLSIRVPVQTRRRLEEVAKLNGRSLTQEVVRRLEDSLADPPHIQAFGKIVIELAKAAELSAAKRWLDDVFTSRALVRAIDYFISRLAPDGPEEVPAALKATAEQVEKLTPGKNIADRYLSTWGLGSSVVEGALYRLLSDESRSANEMREALGLKRQGLNWFTHPHKPERKASKA